MGEIVRDKIFFYEITHYSQYFYPRVEKELNLYNEKGKGVRFFVSRISSMLSNILCTITISNDYGIYIFQNGEVLKRFKHA